MGVAENREGWAVSPPVFRGKGGLLWYTGADNREYAYAAVTEAATKLSQQNPTSCCRFYEFSSIPPPHPPHNQLCSMASSSFPQSKGKEESGPVSEMFLRMLSNLPSFNLGITPAISLSFHFWTAGVMGGEDSRSVDILTGFGKCICATLCYTSVHIYYTVLFLQSIKEFGLGC